MYARVSAALLALLLALPGVAAAQETTGTVNGRVVDAQGLAIPGATVTLTGPQGARTFVSDADGNFSAPFLTPGTYTVRGELQGFKAAEARNVNVSLGQTTTVNLKMEVGGLTETVEVTGAASVVDTRSTTTGAVINSDMLQRVPVGRKVSDTLYLAPGVSSSGSAGRANPSISGGSGLDNQYVVDGVNITNTGYGALGSYSIIFGSLGNATPFDFIKEVQVKTGGYEAEFGQATGGVMNVVTKSGSNNVRGSLFGYARPEALEADWKQFESTNGTVQTTASQVADGGAEAGGPIFRDKLFFFGAINPSVETKTFLAPEGFPLRADGDIERKRKNISYSTKVTWQAANAHRVDASFFGDPSKGDPGPQRTSALEAQTRSSFSELKYGGHNQTVRYDGVFGSNWLLEGSFARAKNIIEETPLENTWRVVDRRVVPNITTGGIGTYEAGNDSENNQFKIASTNVFAGHQVKYGFQFEDVTFSQINQRTGPTYRAHDGRQTATGAVIDIISDVNFGTIYRVIRANFNSDRTTTQKYYNFFIQDSWKVTDRLTVNPGIRYEQQKLAGTIVDDFELKNNWAPRIGVVYDVLGNGRSKLYGNFGVFYARVPNDLAARALSADDGVSREDFFDAGLTQPVPNGVATQTTATAGVITNHFALAGAFPDVIDPDAKLSWKHETIVGFEWEAMTNTNLGVRYIHRGIGNVLEDVAAFPMVGYDLHLPGADSVEYILTNPKSDTPVGAPELGAHFEDPVHNYDAVEFTVDRRFADNWSMLASYRWSRLNGTFEGFYREDNGQSDPGITSLYDFPTNDPSYTAIGGPQFGYPGDIRFLGELGKGPLPLDRPHQFKVSGNYQFPAGLSVGTVLTTGSGKPLTPLAANPNYGNGGEIPTAPRGSGIETIDGFRERTPWESQVDVQAAYSLAFGGARRLTLMADVFNLFNLRRTLDYDAWTDLIFETPNPDFGQPVSQLVAGPQFQAPFTVRLGARFEF